eukprot:917224-Pelagomonas_calceolata.AAC.2
MGALLNRRASRLPLRQRSWNKPGSSHEEMVALLKQRAQLPPMQRFFIPMAPQLPLKLCPTQAWSC